LLSNSGVIWGFCGGMDAPPPIPHKKQGYIGGGYITSNKKARVMRA
jgi:hypothetical protein